MVKSTQRSVFRVLGALTLCLLAACGDSEPDATCGDGAVGGDETCDDGNLFSGDGCSLVCSTESGWTCSEIAGQTLCATTCGDGVTVGDESCDDGNTAAGDGCSPTCTDEVAPTEDCGDGIDNDEDGSTDCDDGDCAMDPACLTPTIEDCGDGVDNDEDGDVDCDDADCVSDPRCDVEPPDEVCDDGVDNDEDTLVDCDDDDCDDDPACDIAPPDEVCDDGVDNDEDTLVDCEDPDCAAECPVGVCGDGELNDGEQCDDGEDNSDTAPDACRTDCSTPTCGDAVIDAGEECDGGGACTDDCRLERCAGEDTVLDLNEGGVASGDGFRFQFGLNATASDDRSPDCRLTSGFDAAVEFRPPTSGLWLLTANGAGTNIPVTLTVGTSCAAEDAIACSFTDGTSDRGAAILELDAAEVYVLSVDSTEGAQGLVVLEAQPVASVAGFGEPCTEGGFDAYCAVGLICLASECAVPTLEFAEEDEACGERSDGLLPCVQNLTCEAGVCTASAGTSCSRPADLRELSSPTGDGALGVSLTNYPAERDAFRCGDSEPGLYVSYTPTLSAWVEFQASSSVLDAEILLAVGPDCGDSFSDLGCAVAVTGTGAFLEVPAGAGEPLILFVGADAPVDLVVREVPISGEGEMCDVDRVASRCGPGLFCNGIGSCEFAGDGSCSAPLDLAGIAGGDVFSDRGHVLGFDTSDNVDTSTGSCGAGGRPDVVYEYTAPGPGSYRFTANGGDEAVSLYARRSCELPGTELDCLNDDTTGLEIALREGERVFLFIETSAAGSAGSLSATGRSRGDRGTECRFDSDCLPDLVCDPGVLTCGDETLDEGDVCGPPLIAECADELVCLDAVCAPPITLGDVCPLLVDGVCEAGLECVLVRTEGRCLSPDAAIGEPCDNVTVTCEGDSLCVGYTPSGIGACQLPGALGDTCFAGEADAQCAAPLVCAVSEEGGAFVCLGSDAVVPLGGSCEDNPRCEAGATCAPFGEDSRPLPGALCYPSILISETCTETLSEGACELGAFCADVGGGELRCVPNGTCFGDSDCAESEWCSAGSCETRGGEGDNCDVGGGERQCVDGLECRDDDRDGVGCWPPEDASCSFSFQCSDGQFCNNAGACASQVPADAPCVSDERGDQCAPLNSCRDVDGTFLCVP